MRIYVSHSREGDYERDLYAPLRASVELASHEFIFPHEGGGRVDSLVVIPTCDLVLADVSFPSTGQGIELGWASAKGVRIVAVAREGAVVSVSVRAICPDVTRYVTADALVASTHAILDGMPRATSAAPPCRENSIAPDIVSLITRILDTFHLGRLETFWVVTDGERYIARTTRGLYGILLTPSTWLTENEDDTERIVRQRFGVTNGTLLRTAGVDHEGRHIPLTHEGGSYAYCIEL